MEIRGKSLRDSENPRRKQRHQTAHDGAWGQPKSKKSTKNWLCLLGSKIKRMPRTTKRPSYNEKIKWSEKEAFFRLSKRGGDS